MPPHSVLALQVKVHVPFPSYQLPACDALRTRGIGLEVLDVPTLLCDVKGTQTLHQHANWQARKWAMACLTVSDMPCQHMCVLMWPSESCNCCRRAQCSIAGYLHVGRCCNMAQMLLPACSCHMGARMWRPVMLLAQPAPLTSLRSFAQSLITPQQTVRMVLVMHVFASR
jgi:hypothetical protein